MQINFNQFALNNTFLDALGCIFIAIVFCSCEKKIIPEASTPIITSPAIVIKNILPKGKEKYLTGSSAIIFNQDQVNTYNLILTYESISFLDANPAAEEYVEAALVFNGDTISPVGVRYKGSIGAYIGCVSGTDWSKPSGYKTCPKLSIQVKLNWKDRKEKFYDLNKLQFHSQNYDKAQLRERMGYWLFAQMGVPAPRAVHARVLINGMYSGLYGLVEEVDNRFVDLNFPNGKGNVYKEVWPINADGNARSPQTFINALKTNESASTNIDLMKAFAKAVAETPAADAPKAVEKYMNIPQTMAYITVDRAIRHDDGPFHWYCNTGGTGCSNHNYYWFEDQKNQKMTLIPWDLDGAFEHVINTANSITVITDKWGISSNGCKAFNYGNNSVFQKSAACDKLTAAWVLYKDEYLLAKTKLQSQIITDAKALAEFDKWALQIQPYIVEADSFYNNGSTSSSKTTTRLTWENAVRTLRQQIIAAGKP